MNVKHIGQSLVTRSYNPTTWIQYNTWMSLDEALKIITAEVVMRWLFNMKKYLGDD